MVREDLRIDDNKALYQATQFCKKGIVGVYILDHQFINLHHTAACRVEFILR